MMYRSYVCVKWVESTYESKYSDHDYIDDENYESATPPHPARQHMSDVPDAKVARPRTLREIYRHDNVLPMMHAGKVLFS